MTNLGLLSEFLYIKDIVKADLPDELTTEDVRDVMINLIVNSGDYMTIKVYYIPAQDADEVVYLASFTLPKNAFISAGMLQMIAQRVRKEYLESEACSDEQEKEKIS